MFNKINISIVLFISIFSCCTNLVAGCHSSRFEDPQEIILEKGSCVFSFLGEDNTKVCMREECAFTHILDHGNRVVYCDCIKTSDNLIVITASDDFTKVWKIGYSPSCKYHVTSLWRGQIFAFPEKFEIRGVLFRVKVVFSRDNNPMFELIATT
jgi:hypothetical protein